MELFIVSLKNLTSFKSEYCKSIYMERNCNFFSFCIIFHLNIKKFNFLHQEFASSPLKWDSTYSVKGVLYIPYADIEEPFEAWYDSNSYQSRIDYYGGTVKTYQLAQEGDYGTSLKVAPVTTNEELNKITCLQVNGTEQRQIIIQPILPDCTKFQLVGEIILHLL